MLRIQKTAVQSGSMTDRERLDAATELVNKSSRALERAKDLFLWAAATLIVTIVGSLLGVAPVVSTSMSCLFGVFLGSAVAEVARASHLNYKSTRILHSV